ncbi:hypothetical protein ACFQBY_00810 [Promicromonospora citrea]|uniref:hypothetical protein n=1 Tax=Promicromonospora citrea TaxID=43677 RepID=UPI001489DCE5|nr:hypothetical protein [Promicromonospora citrea]NNH51548.1 hypothetical protein [Promicromonospora citrea]
MDDEIELLSDGSGLAVIGDRTAVDRFLASHGLVSKDLELPRLATALGAGAAAAQVGSIAGESGRWVKLTKESAEMVHRFGMTPTKTPGVHHAMVGRPGNVKSWLQISKGPGALTSPAVLAGAAGIMAQLAMQQAMTEILDHLAVIEEKIDDVLRAQKDSALSEMIGVDLLIDEAMTVRETVGAVSEVTWSKVQGTALTIARTEAYALRRLDALAEKLERTPAIADLAKVARAAEPEVREWLAVLAHCVRLQDALAVLELDRVLGSAPDELDQHRLGLRTARGKRLDVVARSIEQVMTRMDDAAERANAKVLLNPTASPTVVRSRGEVVAVVSSFREILGVDQDDESFEARRWVEAASDVKDRALVTGAKGVESARRVGGEALVRARTARAGVAGRLAEQARRLADAVERTQD